MIAIALITAFALYLVWYRWRTVESMTERNDQIEEHAVAIETMYEQVKELNLTQERIDELDSINTKNIDNTSALQTLLQEQGAKAEAYGTD
jgi:hypothetical protein